MVSTPRDGNSSRRSGIRTARGNARFRRFTVKGLPSKVTVPAFGRSTPIRQLSKVVLPAPFGPMKVMNSRPARGRS